MQKDFEMQLAVVKVDGGGHPKPNRLVVISQCLLHLDEGHAVLFTIRGEIKPQ